jgi:hypothetical protein
MLGAAGSGLLIVASHLSDTLSLWQAGTAFLANQSAQRELNEALTVEVKTDRRATGAWQKSEAMFDGLSDVVTVLKSGQPAKRLEIYHTAEDQRFNDYPTTTALAKTALPTNVAYEVLPLDSPSRPIAILTVTNQLHSLHDDKQVSVLLIDGSGSLVAKTPYPSESLVTGSSVTNPYSAFRTSGVMFDAVSKNRQDITFCNDFQVVRRNGEVLLQFSWVIDNGPYFGPHLHQIEQYRVVHGHLALVGPPQFAIAEGWFPPSAFKALDDKLVLKRFMASIAVPSMKDLMQENYPAAALKADLSHQLRVMKLIAPPSAADRPN